jgi:hypothetical protein
VSGAGLPAHAAAWPDEEHVKKDEEGHRGEDVQHVYGGFVCGWRKVLGVGLDGDGGIYGGYARTCCEGDLQCAKEDTSFGPYCYQAPFLIYGADERFPIAVDEAAMV